MCPRPTHSRVKSLSRITRRAGCMRNISALAFVYIRTHTRISTHKRLLQPKSLVQVMDSTAEPHWLYSATAAPLQALLSAV
jgi:hypothetical protein